MFQKHNKSGKSSQSQIGQESHQIRRKHNNKWEEKGKRLESYPKTLITTKQHNHELKTQNVHENFDIALAKRWELCNPKICKEKPCFRKPKCPCPPVRNASCDFVIYQPKGPSTSTYPYVGTWFQVKKAVENAKGTLTVYFDSTYQSPIVLDPITVGTTMPSLDGQNRVVFAPAIPKQSAQQGVALWAMTASAVDIVTVLIADGVVFANVAVLIGPMKFIASPNGVSPFVWTTQSVVTLKNTFVLQNGPTSISPLITVQSGQQLTIILDQNSVLDNTPAVTAPIVSVAISGGLAIMSWENSILVPNTITGSPSASAFYGNDGTGILWNQSTFTGTISQVLYEKASFIEYDDTLVSPPFVPSSIPPYGVTVQQALDVLKSKISVLSVVTGTWTATQTSSLNGMTFTVQNNQYNILNTNFIHYSIRLTALNPGPSTRTIGGFRYRLPSASVAITSGGSQGNAWNTSSVSVPTQPTIILGSTDGFVAFYWTWVPNATLDVQITADYQI